MDCLEPKILNDKRKGFLPEAFFFLDTTKKLDFFTAIFLILLASSVLGSRFPRGLGTVLYLA